MPDTKYLKNPILVVGAGPVGLTMAIQLHRHGVPVRIIDKSGERSTTSKALGVHSRTLEILESMGVIDKFLQCGRPAYGVNTYYGGKRIVHLTLDELNCPYPYVLVIPQNESERILEEYALSLGLKVERNIELASFSQTDKGVSAKLIHKESGKEENVETSWMLGCDGSHSAVRKGLQLPFEGSAYEETWAAADVAVECDLPDDEMHVFLTEEGVLASFPFGEGRYRFVFDELKNPPTDNPPSLDLVQSYIDKRSHVKIKISDPHWLTWFKIHRRMVPEYRKGRVFLAGDAAHIHSPMGGQGMNTGIQDANNLAWKLALVIHGAADDSILNSYNAERHPVAEAVLHGTDLATKMATLRNPIAQQVRNSLASFLTSLEVIQHRMQKTVSMMLVNYRKSPIVGEHRQVPAARLLKSADGEAPDFSDWLDFGRGPSPGDRAPDTTVLSLEGANPVRLFDVIRSTKHSLILFDGKPTLEGYKNLAEIADYVRQNFGELVIPYIILAAAADPKNLESDCSTWHDADISAHRAYSAASECLYLIRPDGYVAFRSQPADLEALKKYLTRIFKVAVSSPS